MDKLLKVREVAEWLNMADDRVYTLARENIIPSVRIGRSLRFCPLAVQHLIENGGKALPPR